MSSANVIEFEKRRKPEGAVVADTDNGYTRIANEIMDRLYMLDVSAGAFRVLMAIIRQTYGFQKTTDRFTNTYLQSLTGLGATSVKDALILLEERKVLNVEKSGMFKLISVNKQMTQWQLSGGKSENNKRSNNTQLAANPAELKSRESGHNKPRIRDEVAANPANSGRESGYTKEESLQKKAFKESQDVQAVFEHWKSVMKKSRAQLTPERRTKIKARLEQYPLQMLLDAVDGCSRSDFHMGRQPGKPTEHNDIELICRSGTNLERFAGMPAVVLAADWTQEFVGPGGLV